MTSPHHARAAGCLAADKRPDLYDDFKAAGCEIEGHESDLYVRADGPARSILAKHRMRDGNLTASFFQIAGATWIEIPFHYSPFWRAKQRS